MKTRRISRALRGTQGTQGSVMILTVVITGLIGFTLASYLQLVKSQNYATMRSQAWNATMPVIEAGVEDAMTHLNTHGNATLAVDGWTQNGSTYTIQRNIGSGHYVATIYNWAGPGSFNPTIESRGFVQMPVNVVSSGQYMLAQAGGGVASGYLARGVRVGCGSGALFAKGLVAKGQIDMNGNNISTDSFDSTDPNHSTGGQYDVTKRKDKGDVATNSGLVNSLNVGNADIYGKVSTGPGGSVDVGTTGSVGDLAWHAAGGTGIQTGWSTDDMNVDFRDVEAPWSGGAFTPGSGTVDGTAYNYVLNSGNYQLSNLTMNSTKKMIITGDATLYVTGNIDLGGSAFILVAPGAHFNLYVAGSSANLGGNGVINQTGYATNFVYYGLPSNTSLGLSGNSAFVGVIYAPNADFFMNGAGSGVTDFIGASITSTVTMNGHYKFHYDESLSRFGPNRGYVVRSWDEMTPAEVSSYAYYIN